MILPAIPLSDSMPHSKCKIGDMNLLYPHLASVPTCPCVVPCFPMPIKKKLPNDGNEWLMDTSADYSGFKSCDLACEMSSPQCYPPDK